MLLVCGGGGIRGKLSTSILRKIQEDLNENLYDVFDYYAGTSTGSLITTAIANGYSMDYIDQSLYDYDNMKNIFSTSFKHYFGKVKYNPQKLYDVVDKHFEKKKFGEMDKHCIISSYNYTKRTPVFFNNYDEKDQSCFISDLLKCSSAAPTYFPPYVMDADEIFIDGAMSCNNPTTIACSMIETIILDKLKCLFVGTGYTNYPTFAFDEMKDWGIVDWFLKGNITDLMMNGDEETNRLETKSLLGNNYLHLNCEIVDMSHLITNFPHLDDKKSITSYITDLFYKRVEINDKIDNIAKKNYNNLVILGETCYMMNKTTILNFTKI
jgi:predicted acylesterase/phospholipase RssA